MRNLGIVQGSFEQAKDLIIGKDTVYVHTNITQVTEDKEGNAVEDLYSYNEIQYTKDEYIELLSKKNMLLENDIINTQLALVEVYEMIGGIN